MVHVRFGTPGVIIMALALMASTCAFAVPSVQTYTITTSALAADNPAIWGNYVVWQATGSGATDIFAAAIGGGNVAPGQIMTVCSASGNQSNPTIGAGFVAWEDRRSDTLADIYAASADWGTGAFSSFMVSGRTGAEWNPAIWGGTLVYNYNNGPFLIEAYDLANRTALATVAAGTAQKGAPVINDDYILWQDARGGTTNYDVWGVDRPAAGDFTAIGGSGSQLYPSLYGNTMVWNEISGGYYKIGFKNLTGGASTFLANGAFDMKLPSVYGDYIVWQDKRNGNWDIYGYQISTGSVFVIAGGAGDQDKAQIYGNMVVYRELNGGSSQIKYAMLEVASTPEPTSILALAAGLLGVIGMRSRRRSG